MFRIRLKKLREEKGLTQQSFAEAFGTAQSTVGGWEAGRREPDFDTLRNLAAFFGVTTDYLLGLAERSEEIVELKSFAANSSLPVNELSDEAKDQLLDFAKFLLGRRKSPEK